MMSLWMGVALPSGGYEKALSERASLPKGWAVGTTSFSFSPAEAPAIDASMRLTLLVADEPTDSVAAVFTSNALCGAPVTVGRRRIAGNAPLQAILVNNKISNVCAAGDGVGASEALCAAVGELLELPGGGEAVLPASTGVIGWRLPVDEMVGALPSAIAALQKDSLEPAARAIMTTDRYPKLRAASACGGRLVGIAKGAGMIEPNMATMLAFVLTDVDVPRAELQAMLARAAQVSFNCMSVDADQSTSDTLACASSQLRPLPPGGAAEFEAALTMLCSELAADVARNGEGTTHVIRVRVSGAPTFALARGVGKSIVNSPLFKTAVAGEDPNVGRLASAVGSYLGREAPQLELGGVTIDLGGRRIFEAGKFQLDKEAEAFIAAHMAEARMADGAGRATPFPEHELFVEVAVCLGSGDESATVVGSDLTHEYVEINADYRS